VLTHHAISVLICQAATEADIDPDRVKFTRTVRRATGPAAFPPDHQAGLRAAIMVSISAKRHLNRPATGPARGSSSEPATTPTASREPATGGIHHSRPPTIRLANLGSLTLAA